MKLDCVVVWTTIGAAADAKKLASALLDARLAACVNVLGEMDSVYRWKGQVESDRERQVFIKTTAAGRAPGAARGRGMHEYALPEFLVMPIAEGSEAYLTWIREATAG
jgi:periplasmic divalent cation tolerance protein